MTQSIEVSRPGSRLTRLMGFLDQDPDNLRLIEDAATTAFEEGQPAQAGSLIDRAQALGPLSPALCNLKGLVALQEERFAEAAAIFQALHADAPNDPVLRFNLAWALSMLGEYEAALEALGDGPASAEALLLKVRCLHHLGRLSDAMAVGEGLPQDEPALAAVNGAVAVAALDAEDLPRAAAFAARAPGTPDGLSTLGFLKMDASDMAGGEAAFDAALAISPADARANLGKGLMLMSEGATEAASDYLDRAAERFGRHLGSWVAAGWARFAAGDLAGARQRFEAGLAADDTFAELHGALAVLDIVEGQLQSARRRAAVARRLDPKALSVALASMLLLRLEGQEEAAARVRDLALNAPISPGGPSLAQAMAKFGRQRR